MLVDDLTAEGLEAEYEPPMERRSAGDIAAVVTIVVTLAGGGFLNAAGQDAYQATKRAVERWRARPLLRDEAVDLGD